MAALPKAEQYEKTRSALLTVAHELFAEQDMPTHLPKIL